MRPLSDDERALLARLVSPDFPGAAQLRAQVAAITAVEDNCTCGCSSFTPQIDRSTAPPIPDRATPLPVELQELSRADGVPRTVLLFADEDGYLANVECVYYDHATPEWPVLNNSAVMMHDEMRYLTGVVLPNGRGVRPQDEGDHWVGTDFSDSGFTATTWNGYRERFDKDGDLIERVFVK